MKKHRFFEIGQFTLQSFQYNENFTRWLWFVVETLVAAFVGALIAFVFGDHYRAALISFGILILFLLLLSIFFVVLGNRVSILSIMNRGLNDGRYEDVIKFGSAMRSTLFTANKNDDIVTLGSKIDEAALKIASAHYNRSKGDYLVTIDGKPKSITQIRMGLRIDDLGWSMHLCKRTDEAIVNIIDGIKQARNEALRLSQTKGNEDGEAITPFVKLIIRGYRHLCGIYFEDVNQHRQGIFYENVTKLIMSNYKIVSQDGVCGGSVGRPSGTTCGLLCSLTYEKKVNCSRKNILELYFNAAAERKEATDLEITYIHQFLNFSHGSLMTDIEIEDDIRLFNMLPDKAKQAIIKDQCYAWGRNIVKKVQNGMHKQGEYDFISDEELSSLVAEARAFSQVYYYGTDTIANNDDFHNVIKNVVGGKAELRYASLMNEIELVSLLLPSSQKRARAGESGRNIKIEKLIENLKSTREICRDKRADLYVRASTHLITAYYYEYNLNYRYMTNDAINTSLEARKTKLDHYIRTVGNLYKEITKYERKYNEDLEKKYRSIMGDLKSAKKQLSKKYVKSAYSDSDFIIAKFTDVDVDEYAKHIQLNNISSATHRFSTSEIERVKMKWRDA